MNNSGNEFNIKGKNAEQVVHELALKSFLTDWCYLNPKLPDNKELCDLLVVFDDIAIIWQIKDLKLDEKGKYNRSEVEKNIRQLAGARRQLFDLKTHIELENPRRGKEVFDPVKVKEIYLISVLFGKPEEIYSFVENVKEYSTHIFTRQFTELVLNELDTICDFADYLREKEKLLSLKNQLVLLGGEKELLAHYLIGGRSFKELEQNDEIIMNGDFWEDLQKREEYKAKKKEDKISYVWDEIINSAHLSSVKKYEIVARELARTNRFKRRYLAKVFCEKQLEAHKSERSGLFRRIFSDEGVTYCFVFLDDPEPRDHRQAVLQMMCFIARGLFPKNQKVIGIATEQRREKLGSYDLCLLDFPEWTVELQQKMEELQKRTGWFVNRKMYQINEDEYPDLAVS